MNSRSYSHRPDWHLQSSSGREDQYDDTHIVPCSNLQISPIDLLDSLYTLTMRWTNHFRERWQWTYHQAPLLNESTHLLNQHHRIYSTGGDSGYASGSTSPRAGSCILPRSALKSPSSTSSSPTLRKNVKFGGTDVRLFSREPWEVLKPKTPSPPPSPRIPSPSQMMLEDERRFRDLMM